MRVITISGKAQHGKDTTAGILKRQLEADGYRVLITHYADLLKYICKSFFDWNGNKDDEGRHILQYVGTDVIRKKKPDFWVDFVVDILTLFQDKWDFVLIPDCRFPNEIECLQRHGFGAVHLRVVRQGFESPLSIEQQKHPSEIALDNVLPDYYIDNSGTIEDLEEAVSNWITHLNVYHQVTFNDLVG